MTHRFLDIDYNDQSGGGDAEHPPITEQDGTGLILTKQVRVVYDDETPKDQIYQAIRRAAERFIELRG